MNVSGTGLGFTILKERDNFFKGRIKIRLTSKPHSKKYVAIVIPREGGRGRLACGGEPDMPNRFRCPDSKGESSAFYHRSVLFICNHLPVDGVSVGYRVEEEFSSRRFLEWSMNSISGFHSP